MLDLTSHFGVSRHSRKFGEEKKMNCESNFYTIRRGFYFGNRDYSGGKHPDTCAGNSETRCRGRRRRCNIGNLSRYKGPRTRNRNNSDSFAQRARKYAIQLIRFVYPDLNFHRLFFFRRKMIGSHTVSPSITVFAHVINVRRNFRDSLRSIGRSV